MHDYVREAFDKGECAIARFWGQTHFYVPITVAQQLGEPALRQLAADVFTQERLDRFQWNLYKNDEYYLLELPSVLQFPGPHHPEYNLPEKLAELIKESATK